jgi:hypothetical protein
VWADSSLTAVQKTGDIMTGQLTLPGGGTGSQAATVTQVDAKVSKAGDTMTGGLGIGTATGIDASFRQALSVGGATTAFSMLNDPTYQSTVTVLGIQFRSILRTQATSFTMVNAIHYQAVQATLGAGSAVTTQTGFSVDASIIGATNNYGFRGQIPAGSNRWNLFMDGTALNYMAAELRIGTLTAGGVVSNGVPITAGIFQTATGVSASTATGVPVNIIFLPTVGYSTWLITASVSNVNDVNNYNTTVLVNTNGTAGRGDTIRLGVNLTITVTGLTISATQTSGSNQVISWTVTRVA